jgi:hypothetical protein
MPLRKALRKLTGSRIEGFVDGVVGGEIHGWARDPGQPGRRVHVVALCQGEVVGEALADLPRADLTQEGRGDGRHGFRLRLPATLLDGAPRTVRLEAVAPAGRERLTRGEVEVRSRGEAEEDAIAGESDAPLAGSLPSPSPGRALPAAAARVSLLVWGEGDADATAASWAAQDWPETELLRLGDGNDGELRARAAGAHTVAIVGAGDVLEPSAARILARARPLADVVTWQGAREAQALGVLAGGTLGGAFAVRGQLFSRDDGLWDVLASDGPRAFEFCLAARRELRWTHLAAPLSRGETALPPASAAPQLPGWRRLPASGARPARLVPDLKAASITLAVWPAGGKAAQDTLRSLMALGGDAELDILAAPADIEALSRAAAELSLRASVRPVDPPAAPGAGGWLRRLSDAASGEVVLMARAGTTLGAAGVLEELAAWSLSPLAGAVTIPLTARGRPRMAGLGLEPEGTGWRAVSADRTAAPESHPVLAAPAAFLAVARAKLAAVGGVDDHAFPDQGADLDLALRLRRAGWHSLLLGLPAAALASAPAPGPAGAALAPFDPGELAAAAAAFPVRR